MRLVLTITFFLFNATIIFSQSGWIKQSSGTTENLNSVFFTDTNHGIVVGNNGTLLRTTDGGTNWHKVSNGTTNNLSTVSFIDLMNGFVWGSNRTFLRTTDGGNTWLNLSDTLSTGLIPSSFLDTINAVAIKTENDSIRVFKTTDGGLTWEKLSQFKGYLFRPQKIYYLDYNNIVIAGSETKYAVVYESSDGGISWKNTLSIGAGANGGFADASFIDSKTGFVLAYHGMTSQYFSWIYKTTDGGLNWKQLTDGKLPQCVNIYMIDENNGFTVGSTQVNQGTSSGSGIFKTTDGGKTWTRQVTSSALNYNTVFFTDINTGTIVGDGGAIIRTTTSGIVENSEWTSQYQDPNPYPTDYSMKDVLLFDSHNGFALGDSPLLQTIDGGINWQKISVPIKEGPLYVISFKDNKIGTVTGTRGWLYNTTDGGNTWSTFQFPENFEDMRWRIVKGFHFIDELREILIAELGVILYTSDGGVNWTRKDVGTNVDMNDIFFTDEKTGYIAADDGNILKANDGGLSWSYLNSSVPNSLYGIFFTEINKGFAVGEDGCILQTTDSGKTWLKKERVTSSNLNKVYFRDKNNGLIVGELGTILRTTDGGENWSNEPSGTNVTLLDVAIKDSVEMVVGEYRTVLRNTNDFKDSAGKPEIPQSFSLFQNYPNPFNPSTVIRYQIPYSTNVSLKFYDVLGREIAKLVNEQKEAGKYEVTFNGSGLVSGVYFYRLVTGSFWETKKLMLLK